MKVYAISDLHLSKVCNKPMKIFGSSWLNYWDIIREDWKRKVAAEDVVLIAGDISWGINLEQAKPDIDEIAELPGKIVISKGNHDYWWPSMKKMKEWLPNNIQPMFNNCIRIENILICGSRLWSMGAGISEEDKKILAHEKSRLKISLDEMLKIRKEGDVVIVMTHFPPFDVTYQDDTFTKMFEEYKVDKVVYGHLHGDICRAQTFRRFNGIEYYLTACDQVSNLLVSIL